MGNRIVTQGVYVHYQITLKTSDGIEYTTTKNTSPRPVNPSTSVGPVGRQLTYKDNYTFTSSGGPPITLEVTATFNLNYNTTNVTALRLSSNDQKYLVTFTINSFDFKDPSGNTHTRDATGTTTATYPASIPGFNCPCPPTGPAGATGANTEAISMGRPSTVTTTSPPS